MICEVVLKYLRCDCPACDSQFPYKKIGLATKNQLLTEATEAGWDCETLTLCPKCNQTDNPKPEPDKEPASNGSKPTKS